MNKNIGRVDRFIRLILGLFLLTFLIVTKTTGIMFVVGIILVIVMLFTAFIQLCPIYSIFRFSTKNK